MAPCCLVAAAEKRGAGSREGTQGEPRAPSGGRRGRVSGARVHRRGRSPELEEQQGGRRRCAGPRLDGHAQVSAQGEGEGGRPGADAGRRVVQVPSARPGDADATAPRAVFAERGRTGLGRTSRPDLANRHSKT